MGKLALIGLGIIVLAYLGAALTNSYWFLPLSFIGGCMFGWFGSQWFFKRKFGY